jgi:hypothetical protein
MLIIASKPSLPAMAPHPAWSALPGHRFDRYRRRNLCPRRPNLPGQVKQPGPQLGVVLDAMPLAVAEDDETVRWPNP